MILSKPRPENKVDIFINYKEKKENMKKKTKNTKLKKKSSKKTKIVSGGKALWIV